MEFELEIPKKQFQVHLEIPKNQRIIFSGAFGTGKTYFLDKFFKGNERYEGIHIYPVNYSVASNEDIFELIKYDIFFKLLEKGLDFEQVEVDKGTFLPFFLNNHATEIIPFLLGLIPKVGASLKDIANGLIELNKKFEKEFKEANLTEQDKIIDYLKEFSGKKGSILEDDLYTQLICSLVNQIQENGKEVVLIIDDLDRIDPEHIFRIMNVLAAHVDIKKDSDQNKFDSNKIILVCDIENIRKIFSNRYGADVDFSGYIDKFYSRSVFHYDLSGEMIKSVNKLFHTVVLDYGNKKMSLGEVRKDVAGAIIKQILHSFIQHDLISIRVLKRIFSGTQSLKERYVWREGKYDAISNNDIELVKAVDFLIFLFQDYKLFVEKCKVLINRDIEILDSVSNHFFINQIVKAGNVKNYWSNNKERPKEVGQELQFEIQIDSFNLRYTISTEFDSYSLKDRHIYSVNSISDSIGQEIKIDDINFFLLLVGLLEKTDFKSLLNLKFDSV
ncbi:KAP family P-loop domain protein [Belliella baltica DSM 15883]|uniref:KAP family P-loop domain protein n=1 Tax=Belliella baltica (strain DSM 15883 / CIP 108006 / LMG 21964 / BA134) TaxID=866536 RepID=I3ZA84_BELBD|nr:P-loop NTPase fold protein [Belliella baltica]AFL86152.1 KAP family P-loop domain protein [Belliella baltica DSM 15883]